MHSAWFRCTFARVLKFLQIRKWGLNFWREPTLQNVWIIWSPLLYFSFQSSMNPNFLSYIRFQCILHDSLVLFPEFWNFYKLKRQHLISGRNQFSRKSELFSPHFCISVLKVLWTQVFRHSLDFNAFLMMQEYSSRTFKFLQIKEWGTTFWGEQILQNVSII